MKLLIIINAVMMSSGQILFKKAALFANGKESLSFFDKYIFNPWMITAVFVYATTTVLWVYLLTKIQLNIAYPIMIGLSYVITIFGAYLFFKETISIIGLIGVFLIIIGIIFLSL